MSNQKMDVFFVLAIIDNARAVHRVGHSAFFFVSI
jgi:hypothetical protein